MTVPVKKDWIRIESLDNFMLTGRKITKYHPDDPRHTPYWRELKNMCIEGLWGKDFGKYRFMPGRLFFYGTFCTIEHTNKIDKTRWYTRPDIRDLEWERAYIYLECEGFSGWSNDDEFTSEHDIKEYIDKYDIVKTKRIPRFHKADGTFKTFISPKENIRKLHDKPMGVPLYMNNTRNNIELGCLAANVKVRMFDGTLKCAKDISVDDILMGPDSKPRVVQNLVRGEALMYDYTPRYGKTYRATDSHLHRVAKHKKNVTRGKYLEYYDLDANELLDISNEQLSRQYEFVQASINYQEADQKLDPYFIGAWLGDGFKREKAICYLEEDDEHIDYIKEICNTNPKLSYTIQDRDTGQSGSKSMKIIRVQHQDMMYKNNYWSKTFRNNKHIPENYMIASRDQRLKLLAGMIDTDGTYQNGRFTITQSEKQLDLLKQFEELARSLGFKAKIHKPHVSGIANAVKYNLRITGAISEIPTKITRKKGQDTNLQGSSKNHISIDVSSAKVEPFYGFEVDGDHLFMLEDYTVTHNSRGGGKSYWYSLGGGKYRMCFDAVKYLSLIHI